MEGAYLERAKEGDEVALNFLMDKYKDFAYSIALKVCNDQELAQDIVQNAFINVFLSIHKFRSESKFSTWLYKIVYRESLKLKKATMTTTDLDELNDVYLGNKDANSNTIKNERKNIIRFALDKLNAKERLVMDLFYLNEKEILEIVDITKLSKSNIKVLLHRGRKSMKQILEKYLKEEIQEIL
ncbi:sigma-70 family RNA polymerase sigma factor [Aquimarina gracilis]|uniref:RNA polymerase sigma factor n=1 Tax=Aquimarina gracilis TaxID=874422 RepID=A0ABU5ZU93_9FLAO|nr:sigma-70 family RNA polymerase sigma factor [Aquimarina gracilis]MEB3345644.1 sigma-70 family RNA polymerase sigma factor [Aquimarina gracilis]